MSLKAFHIFFIATSVVLAIGIGIWQVSEYLETGRTVHILEAAASLLVAVGLAVYGVRFLKKLKHVGYL